MTTFSIHDDKTYSCKKYVSYKPVSQKPSNRVTIDRSLNGLQLEKGWIHKRVDFNTFETVATKIPPNYRKQKSGVGYHCNESKTRLYASDLHNDNTKKYLTHDNGGRAFLVKITKESVQVFKRGTNVYVLDSDFSENDQDNLWMFNEHVITFHPEHVFIGKAQKNAMTRFSCGYGKDFDGNSILLHLGKNKYAFIGEEVYTFSVLNKDPILKFYSPVGNSDCPFAYGVSEKNVYFLSLGSQHVIPIDEFEIFNHKVEMDPSDAYYNQDLQKLPLKKFKLVCARPH
jgi:hypothetical protein